MILVTRLAALSAISLLVIPMCDGVHISLMSFVVDFNSVWIFWVISFEIRGVWKASKALSKSLKTRMWFEVIFLVNMIAS